jgi:hypothetical protein
MKKSWQEKHVRKLVSEETLRESPHYAKGGENWVKGQMAALIKGFKAARFAVSLQNGVISGSNPFRSVKKYRSIVQQINQQQKEQQ